MLPCGAVLADGVAHVGQAVLGPGLLVPVAGPPGEAERRGVAGAGLVVLAGGEQGFPEAIVPYSVADYLAQAYHDARCVSSSCTGSPPCAPAGTENRFGCDQHGVLGINEIGGSRPMLPWPPPGSPCQLCKINSKFAPLFQRTVYAVVRFAPTADNIPPYLEPFFAASTAGTPGWACSSPQALKDIKAYGFLPLSGLPALLPRAGVSSPSPQCGTAHH